MCRHRPGLLSLLEIGLEMVLLLALMSVETSSALPSAVRACLETEAPSPSSFENAGVEAVVAGCCTAAAVVAGMGCREMERDVARWVGESAVEVECDQVVHLAEEEGRRSLKVVGDSVVHSLVVRSLVKAAEEADGLRSGSVDKYEQPILEDRITFVIWWSCRDVRLVEIRADAFDSRGKYPPCC